MKKMIKAMMATMIVVFAMTFVSFAGTDEEAAKAVTAINSYRQQNGLSALSVDNTIVAAAKIRAAESAVNNSHTRPDGTPWYTVNDNIYGECLAESYQKAEDVVNAWVKSETHKKILVSNNFTNVNIQVYVSGDGAWHWAAEFE